MDDLDFRYPSDVFGWVDDVVGDKLEWMKEGDKNHCFKTVMFSVRTWFSSRLQNNDTLSSWSDENHFSVK